MSLRVRVLDTYFPFQSNRCETTRESQTFTPNRTQMLHPHKTHRETHLPFDYLVHLSRTISTQHTTHPPSPGFFFLIFRFSYRTTTKFYLFQIWAFFIKNKISFILRNGKQTTKLGVADIMMISVWYEKEGVTYVMKAMCVCVLMLFFIFKTCGDNDIVIICVSCGQIRVLIVVVDKYWV